MLGNKNTQKPIDENIENDVADKLKKAKAVTPPSIDVKCRDFEKGK